MEYVLLGISTIFSIVALVCAILVAVKMLQNDQTAMGVITIIGLFVCGIGYLLALIFGWQNRNAWSLQKVMPIFTVSLILSMVLGSVGFAIMTSKAVDEFNRIQSEQDGGEFDSGIEEPAFEDFEIEVEEEPAQATGE